MIAVSLEMSDEPLFVDMRHGAAAQASMEMQSVSRWRANSFWA